MAAVNPFDALDKIIASMPTHWTVVTPHATNYLKTQGSDYVLAVGLRAGDDGDISYEDVTGATVTQSFRAGEIIPGLFARVFVTGTTCTKIYAGFM